MRVVLLKKMKHWYKLIPACLTLANSLCGFGAILYTLQAYAPPQGHEIPQLFAVSAWWIICAMMFDMMDGWTARALDARSDRGIQLDSLADMVTFGVAPAVIVAVMAHTNQIDQIPYRWVWGLCAVYLGCTTSRLSLYNVLAMNGAGSGAGTFRGLPSPGAAAGVCSLIILYSHPQYANRFVVFAELLPFYAALLGLLMVSPIPYAHIAHWLGNKRKNKLKILLLIIFFMLFAWNPRLVAAVAIHAYVISGPLTMVYRRCARLVQPSPRGGENSSASMA